MHAHSSPTTQLPRHNRNCISTPDEKQKLQRTNQLPFRIPSLLRVLSTSDEPPPTNEPPTKPNNLCHHNLYSQILKTFSKINPPKPDWAISQLKSTSPQLSVIWAPNRSSVQCNECCRHRRHDDILEIERNQMTSEARGLWMEMPVRHGLHGSCDASMSEVRTMKQREAETAAAAAATGWARPSCPLESEP
jgi:hypothetical protein